MLSLSTNEINWHVCMKHTLICVELIFLELLRKMIIECENEYWMKRSTNSKRWKVSIIKKFVFEYHFVIFFIEIEEECS